MTTNIPVKRPGQLWTAIIILYVQTVFNGGGGFLVLLTAAEEAEHGRDALALYLLGAASVLIGAVLLAGAVLLTRGVGWARVPVAVVESIGIAGGLLAVAMGAVTNVVGIGLCVLVLGGLFHHTVREWFDPRPGRPRAGQRLGVVRAPGAPGSPEWWGVPAERRPDFLP